MSVRLSEEEDSVLGLAGRGCELGLLVLGRGNARAKIEWWNVDGGAKT